MRRQSSQHGSPRLRALAARWARPRRPLPRSGGKLGLALPVGLVIAVAVATLVAVALLAARRPYHPPPPPPRQSGIARLTPDHGPGIPRPRHPVRTPTSSIARPSISPTPQGSEHYPASPEDEGVTKPRVAYGTKNQTGYVAPGQMADWCRGIALLARSLAGSGPQAAGAAARRPTATQEPVNTISWSIHRGAPDAAAITTRGAGVGMAGVRHLGSVVRPVAGHGTVPASVSTSAATSWAPPLAAAATCGAPGSASPATTVSFSPTARRCASGPGRPVPAGRRHRSHAARHQPVRDVVHVRQPGAVQLRRPVIGGRASAGLLVHGGVAGVRRPASRIRPGSRARCRGLRAALGADEPCGAGQGQRGGDVHIQPQAEEIFRGVDPQ